MKSSTIRSVRRLTRHSWKFLFQYLQLHKERENGVFSKDLKNVRSVLVYVFRSVVSRWHELNVDFLFYKDILGRVTLV